MTTLCIIYVSEGLKTNVIKQLTDRASSGGPLVHSFVDAIYGRTSFYLMGEEKGVLLDPNIPNRPCRRLIFCDLNE